MKYISHKSNPIDIKRGIDHCKPFIFDFLEEISISCEKYEDIYNIAKVACNFN